MLKTTRTRLGSPAWLAVGLVILVPALAEAQLFPNRTIRREKPDCANEPPFYKQVRRDYFGYYPTCWSRFPAGWGCPCPDPELQNYRAAFANDEEAIKKKAKEMGDSYRDSGDSMPDPQPNPGGDRLPLPPTGTSPFEIESKPATPLPPPPGRGPGAGNPGASLAPSSPSMMELPALPSTAPTSGTEPASRPGTIAMYPEDATLASNSSTARPDLGPLPSAPTPAPFTPENGSSSLTTVGSIEAATVLGTPKPAAQAPKRRSLLGQLFGRNNTTTQNR